MIEEAVEIGRAVLLRVFTLTCLSLFTFSAHSAEVGFDAKVFALDNGKKDPLFTYQQIVESNDGARVRINTFKDKDGQTVVIETSEFAKVGEIEKLRFYKISQRQLSAEATITVKDGKALFTYTRDGKTKTSSETIGEDFVVGPSMMLHLHRNWEQVKRGNKVKVRLGVADRAETVGFEFYKDREETLDGKNVFVLKMKPSSFLIAALVKPIYLFVTPDGETLLEVRGRTQLKQKVGSSWKDLDAITVYEYPTATQPAGNSK